MGVKNSTYFKIPQKADAILEDGSIYFDPADKLKVTDYNSVEKTVAFTGENSVTFITGPATTHIINHGLGKEDLVYQVRLDNGGSPGQLLEVESEPTVGSETTAITHRTVQSLKLHTTILN